MKFKAEYIGTVTGRTRLMDGDKNVRNMTCYWVLTVGPFWFGRRAKRIGECGGSEASIEAKARVSAWLRGGPLPKLDKEIRATPPVITPKPEKSAPVIRLAVNNEEK